MNRSLRTATSKTTTVPSNVPQRPIVCANKRNMWAMSTENLWSDRRKIEVFGEKFIPVSLCPTHGRACDLTRGYAASNPQSGGASCFYSA